MCLYINIIDHNYWNPKRNTNKAKKEIRQSKKYHQRRRESRKCNTKLISSTGKFAVFKWKIIISSIIILMCHLSHVQAIQRGRLIAPSNFAALSGDLHVQIHFSGNEYTYSRVENEHIGTNESTMSQSTATEMTKKKSFLPGLINLASQQISVNTKEKYVENMSTLVISKFIEPPSYEGGTTAQAAQNNSKKIYNNTIYTLKANQVLKSNSKEVVQNIPLYPDPRNNITQITVPCQTFMRGGLYEMQVITNMKTVAISSTYNRLNTFPPSTTVTKTLLPSNDERLRQTVDVRWPRAELLVSPMRLHTYPNFSVDVILRFPEVNCDRALNLQDLPEFWLELIFCGKERSCAQLRTQHLTKSSILYSEQVHGFPKQKKVQLKCKLFGLAGNYAVQLRPSIQDAHVPITRRFLTVDWSDKFVFNVYARSIFPCNPHTGIGVLFEYPSCILDQRDRVRIFAKQRVDVASLKPPTTLHYIAEQRVIKSQYSMYFNCDLFTEKFVEYCFVYVSQAISGAVADVRMDCVPTLPISDSDTGGWGPWSEWTPCSTNCLGGTRNRYRICDSPPPRYGANFCEGPSVETENCGPGILDNLDCIYETRDSNSNLFNYSEVSQDLGLNCQCGCIVNLGSFKRRGILAGASKSCPGRSFWLIQVNENDTISFTLNFLRVPCSTQYIRIRDGLSITSTLLVDISGGGGVKTVSSHAKMPTLVKSSGDQLLIEFFAGEESENSSSIISNSSFSEVKCTGGFMASFELIEASKNVSNNIFQTTTKLSSSTYVMNVQRPKALAEITLVHLSAVIFASFIVIISAMLGAQYILRYRKYHLAIAQRRDQGSRIHTPRTSISSLPIPPSRAMSTTTLLSEVLYLVKMGPKHQLRHSLCNQSIDADNMESQTKLYKTRSQEQMTKCNKKVEKEIDSNGSVLTLCNEITLLSVTNNLSFSSSTKGLVKKSATSPNAEVSGHSPPSTGDKDSASIISSGMSSVCNSPKHLTKHLDSDAVVHNVHNSQVDISPHDSNSMHSSSLRLSYIGSRSVNASLANGCYSPAACAVSTAMIRTTNPKESKEKQNRKKLLTKLGSEFSLNNQEELELDYYDYNVINAGAAPGSYLGMDPAYLVWVPPFEDITDDRDCKDNDKLPDSSVVQPELDETKPFCKKIKILKNRFYLNDFSKTEINKSITNMNLNTNDTAFTSDKYSPPNRNHHLKTISPIEINLQNDFLKKTASAEVPSFTVSHNQSTSLMPRKLRKQKKQQSKSTVSLRKEEEAITLRMLRTTKSPREHQLRDLELKNFDHSEPMTSGYVEKETLVVKSQSDLQSYLALDDIQFADESESDHDTPILKRRKNPVKVELVLENINMSSLSSQLK